MEQGLQVLVAEKSRSLAAFLVELLEEANFTVAVATSEDEALAMAVAQKPEVVLASVSRFDGELLSKRLRGVDREVAIGLIYPPARADDAEPRARMVGADLVLLGPVQRAALVSSVRLLVRLRRQARALATSGAMETATDLTALKKQIGLEVKRSRRYKYPVSVLLVSLDEPEDDKSLARDERTRRVAAGLGVLHRLLRDIDLCMPLGQDRYVVLLPHTAEGGARVVGTRLLAELETDPSVALRAAIGVAAYDGNGAAVSFGSLLKDATAAMLRAKTQPKTRLDVHGPKRTGERVFIA